MEPEGAAEDFGHFLRREAGFGVVCAAEGVVVEGDAVDGGDEEERPVGAALGLCDVSSIVNRQENVRYFREIGKGGADLAHVGLFH